MKELIELRIPESTAARVLSDSEGMLLGGVVRKVRYPAHDPKLAVLAAEQRRMTRAGRSLITAWRILRSYSREEWKKVELFRISVRSVFEPCGEECGTVYDEGRACARCGSGRGIDGALVLDERSLKSAADVRATIADEVIVSERAARVLLDLRASGFKLKGIRARGRRNRLIRGWRELRIEDRSARIGRRTRCGTSPLDADERHEFRCECGGVLGLNLLSPLSIERSSWSGRDLGRTEQFVGIRRGYLAPTPLIVASPRVVAAMKEAKLRGFEAEVAELE